MEDVKGAKYWPLKKFKIIFLSTFSIENKCKSFSDHLEILSNLVYWLVEYWIQKSGWATYIEN